MKFLVGIRLSSDFYKVKISTSCKKIILQFFVLSIPFTRTINALQVVIEMYGEKKGLGGSMS